MTPTTSPLAWSTECAATLQSMLDGATRRAPSAEIKLSAQQHQDSLLKPPGSLGILEDLAIWLASIQHTLHPKLEKRQCLVFAGNHGVIQHHPYLSAYPMEITAYMVDSFHQKTAAVSQLCKHFNVELGIHAFDLEKPSQDFTLSPALTEQELLDSLQAGFDAVNENSDIVCLGEMGIGNTTSAAAMAYALYGEAGSAARWCGLGTGIDEEKYQKKCMLVEKTVSSYREAIAKTEASLQPLMILRCLGGYEFAGLVGAILKARTHLIPVIIDGFACSVAAAIVDKIDAHLTPHLRVSHCSLEHGHSSLLQKLNWQALLNLRMRLGEASGTLLALSLCDAALSCHNGMGKLPPT